MPGKASKLVKDLSNVPSIVGSLGLAVCEAQKAFNVDYLDNIERLLGLIDGLLNPKKGDNELLAKADDPDSDPNKDFKERFAAAQSQIQALLLQMAPSRYQFTETTLTVKMDLAQTMDMGASVGFSAGTGAVALNAALTVGFGYDYRAAAEVRTSIHAIPPDDDTFKKLMGRAKELNATSLPAGANVDQNLVDKSHAVVVKMLGVETSDIDKPKVGE